MAKGIGLIGNFRGKVGNMVGYNLKDSNNKQTQGVRVYQPIVKNPKTYGQAEQRAKLAPINATYRALKMIIDRGQEGKAYGNKSRLAWLSAAMKAFNGGWFEKGAAITAPALVPLTKGSLVGLSNSNESGSSVSIRVANITGSAPTTIGAGSALLLAAYPHLKEGDQITAIGILADENNIFVDVQSIVLDTTSTEEFNFGAEVGGHELQFLIGDSSYLATSIVLSREGSNGQHLRSTANIEATEDYPATILNDAAKEAAIKSYMTGGSNTDWAEESLQS